jgi:hypothetical protein
MSDKYKLLNNLKRLTQLLTLGLASLLSTAVIGAVPDIDAPGIQRAMEVQENHTPALLQQTGVVGTAVSVNGLGKPVINVFTEHSGIGNMPQLLSGIPVIVKVTGKIYARRNPCSGPPASRPDGCGDDSNDDPIQEPTDNTDPTSRFDRPVAIGVSTGHPAITAGTIGARVTNGTDVYALSNNHVYADENTASTGDPVIQPGTYDGGSSPADDMGTLAAYAPITFSTNASNVLDAAIALSSTSLLSNSTPSNGYGTPKSNTIAPQVGMRVMKYGRTTGFTKGRVYAINAIVNVGYSTGVARFVNQIIITPGNFSAGGDSGSLIVADGKGNQKRRPVGLLFAGSSTITIANPIDDVLQYFGVTIDGN